MEPNPRKTLSVLPLGKVDIAALREAVLAIPEDVWEAENAAKPNRFDALDQAGHIPFRFVRKFDDWRVSDNCRLWDEWRALLEPVLAQATAPYGYAHGAFPRIMLARLPAGGIIRPHQDLNRAAKWPHKIHVPIRTSPDCTFFVQGVGRFLPEGEAFEVNNMGMHAVANKGAEDRIHLIFEYYDLDQPEPDWIAGEPIAATSAG